MFATCHFQDAYVVVIADAPCVVNEWNTKPNCYVYLNRNHEKGDYTDALKDANPVPGRKKQTVVVLDEVHQHRTPLAGNKATTRAFHSMSSCVPTFLLCSRHIAKSQISHQSLIQRWVSKN